MESRLRNQRRLTDADREEIWRLFEELGNRRDVARRVGWHYNTVLLVIATKERRCIACGDPLEPSSNFKRCATCRKRIAEHSKVYKAQRLRNGLCVQCNNPVEPPSKQYCAKHRLMHINANERYHARRLATGGTPTVEERFLQIRKMYGLEAAEVWQEHEGRCELCGIGHAERAVHIHHIDKNHANRVRTNFACLCQRCHRLVHLLTEHADPAGALPWMRATYPHLSL